nr:hypothetical protein Q903MT_gene6136 [Picea sitchensis]
MAMKRNRKRNSFSYPILLVGKLAPLFGDTLMKLLGGQ